LREIPVKANQETGKVPEFNDDLVVVERISFGEIRSKLKRIRKNGTNVVLPEELIKGRKSLMV
jgi:glycerol-3-phosphate responsive antiterminator